MNGRQSFSFGSGSGFGATGTGDDDKVAREKAAFTRALKIAISVGVVGLVVYAVATARLTDGVGAGFGAIANAIGVGLIIAGAAFAIGSLVGFVFGIPRSQQPDGPPPADSGGSGDNSSGRTLQVNTNLEQISDWLTKILVGVGLTQLAQLPGGLTALGTFLGAAFGSEGDHEVFAVSLVVYFDITGFLFGYLATRLVIQGALARADNEAAQVAARSGDIAIVQEAFSDADPGMTSVHEDVRVAAQNVRNLPLSALTTVDQLTAWAKAQAAAENYHEAAEAMRRAQDLDPGNLDVHVELLRMQTLAGGRTEKGAEQLRRAQQRIMEGLIYNALYQPAPKGFETAIKTGNEYLGEFDPKSSVLVYLAAAYGQKYAWQKSQGASDPDLAESRAQALKYVKQAIDAAPRKKVILQMLWNPKYPGKDPQENDLEVFYDDAEFKDVLS